MVNRDEPKSYLRGLNDEPISFSRWEELTDPPLEPIDERRVGRTEVTSKSGATFTISTVWCGRLHLDAGLLPWETALFGSDGDIIEVCDRYRNRKEAEEGHAKWVARWQELIK